MYFSLSNVVSASELCNGDDHVNDNSPLAPWGAYRLSGLAAMRKINYASAQGLEEVAATYAWLMRPRSQTGC